MVLRVQTGTLQRNRSTPEHLRILLVEDKTGAAARLKVQLEGQGHHIVGVAQTSRQAIDDALRLKPELVIIELWLNGIDGVEAARTILAKEPLPVVLLVGRDAAEVVRRAREVGIMASLVTPADTHRLGEIIDLAFARFKEFQTIRRDALNLDAAFIVRNNVEQAKRILMRCLRIPESEAFGRMWQARTARSGLGELAAAIVRSEKVVKEANLIQSLQSLLPAIRRGLSAPH